MTPFAPQGNQPQIPQGIPLPMMAPPFALGFSHAVPPMQQASGQAQPARPIPFFGAQSTQQTQSQPPFPFAPFGPLGAGAQTQQPAMPSFPMMPFLQFPNAQPQQSQSMPAFPFAMPSFGQAAPNAQPPVGPQGFSLPFAPIPQPFAVYEQILKTAIDFLSMLLSQSEAARGAIDPSDTSNNTGQQADQGDSPNTMMPGFGCQLIPGPQQLEQQRANEVGMMPRDTGIGSILGVLFGASNTDYFYED